MSNILSNQARVDTACKTRVDNKPFKLHLGTMETKHGIRKQLLKQLDRKHHAQKSNPT